MSGPINVRLPVREFGDQGRHYEVASCKLGRHQYALLIVTGAQGKKTHLVLGWRHVANICWGLIVALFRFRA